MKDKENPQTESESKPRELAYDTLVTMVAIFNHHLDILQKFPNQEDFETSRRRCLNILTDDLQGQPTSKYEELHREWIKAQSAFNALPETWVDSELKLFEKNLLILRNFEHRAADQGEAENAQKICLEIKTRLEGQTMTRDQAEKWREFREEFVDTFVEELEPIQIHQEASSPLPETRQVEQQVSSSDPVQQRPPLEAGQSIPTPPSEQPEAAHIASAYEPKQAQAEQPAPKQADAAEQPALKQADESGQPAPKQADAAEQPALKQADEAGQPAPKQADEPEQPSLKQADEPEQPALKQADAAEQPALKQADEPEQPAPKQAEPKYLDQVEAKRIMDKLIELIFQIGILEEHIISKSIGKKKEVEDVEEVEEVLNEKYEPLYTKYVITFCEELLEACRVFSKKDKGEDVQLNKIDTSHIEAKDLKVMAKAITDALDNQDLIQELQTHRGNPYWNSFRDVVRGCLGVLSMLFTSPSSEITSENLKAKFSEKSHTESYKEFIKIQKLLVDFNELVGTPEDQPEEVPSSPPSSSP